MFSYVMKQGKNGTRHNTCAAAAQIGGAARSEGLQGQKEEMAAVFVWEEVSRGAGWILLWPRFLQSLLSVYSMFEWLYREIAFIVSTQEK